MERRRVGLFRHRGLGTKPLGLLHLIGPFRKLPIVTGIPRITLRGPARAHPFDRCSHRAPLSPKIGTAPYGHGLLAMASPYATAVNAAGWSFHLA